MKHVLFPEAELRLGEIRPVTLGSVDVAVIKTPDGELHALRDRCSHMGAKLSRGEIVRVLDGDDTGHYTLTDDYVVRCPWHCFEFDVDTGRCIADPTRTRVKSYAVRVEGGDVVVDL